MAFDGSGSCWQVHGRRPRRRPFGVAQEDAIPARFDLELISGLETKPPAHGWGQSQPTVIMNSYEHLALSSGDESVRRLSKRPALVARQDARAAPAARGHGPLQLGGPSLGRFTSARGDAGSAGAVAAGCCRSRQRAGRP
jgi:hypothetical protein